MHRFTLILIATTADASAVVWTNAEAQTDTQGSERSEFREEFAAVSGGHYFGEDEPTEVKRLAPNELKARLRYGSDNSIARRPRAKSPSCAISLTGPML